MEETDPNVTHSIVAVGFSIDIEMTGNDNYSKRLRTDAPKVLNITMPENKWLIAKPALHPSN